MRVPLYLKNSVLFSSIFCVIIILISAPDLGYYKFSFFIPLVFGFCFRFTLPNHISLGPGLFMCFISLFIRYLISPLLESISKFNNHFYITFSNEDVLESILLVVFEILAIFFSLNLFNKIDVRKWMIVRVKFERYNFIIVSVIILGILSVLFNPSLLDTFSFFLNSSEISKERLKLDSAVLNVVFSISKTFLVVTLFSFYYNKYKRNDKFIYFILAAFCIALPGLFFSGSSRLSMLLPLVSGMFLLFRFFPKKRKLISVVFLNFIFFSMALLSMYKFFKAGSIQSVSTVGLTIDSQASLLSAYFAGLHNVIVGVVSERNFQDSIGFDTLLNDIFGNAMGISQYFNAENNSASKFNSMIYTDIDVFDQIIPTCIQNLYYFKGIPIFSILMLYSIVVFDKIYIYSNSIYIAYICALVAVLVGFQLPGNITHLAGSFINTFVPMCLLLVLNVLIKIKLKLR